MTDSGTFYLPAFLGFGFLLFSAVVITGFLARHERRNTPPSAQPPYATGAGKGRLIVRPFDLERMQLMEQDAQLSGGHREPHVDSTGLCLCFCPECWSSDPEILGCCCTQCTNPACVGHGGERR